MNFLAVAIREGNSKRKLVKRFRKVDFFLFLIWFQVEYLGMLTWSDLHGLFSRIFQRQNIVMSRSLFSNCCLSEIASCLFSVASDNHISIPLETIKSINFPVLGKVEVNISVKKTR